MKRSMKRHIELHEERSTFRVVSWNVENLVPWLAAGAPPLLARLVDDLGSPDALCLQEIRIRPTDADLIDGLKSAVPGYLCGFSLCRDRENVKFRGGRAHGVATFIRDTHAPLETIAPGWDREGRVVVTRLSARGLSIVNLYAVNGTSRPYYDHDLQRIGGDRHAFKRRVQDRLFELARDLESAGGVVLAGDWNVSRSAVDTHPRLRTEPPHAQARAELNQHIAGGGLVDAYRHCRPDERGYTWFNPRARNHLDAARVDYILVSASLVPAIRDATILPAPPGYPATDHVPIALELEL